MYSWQAIKNCYSFQTNCIGGTENHLTSVAGGSLAGDVIWDAGGYQPFTPVLPVLQLADGSYIGSLNGTAGNAMMAFDAAGNVRWTTPGYSPQMATADGGIIATGSSVYDPASGTYLPGPVSTFDANGTATGQLANFPTFSWKAAYQLGSTEEVVPSFDLANIALTFAATPGGNLTGNGFSLRNHTFGIVFCNTGTGGDGACPVANPKDDNPPQVTPMKFSYLPGIQIDGTNFQQACDFSVSSSCDNNTAHPEWIDAIKIQALNAYKAAFASLPAIISHNVAADMRYGGQNYPRFEHIVYVDGTWFTYNGGPAPGDTTRGDFSWVFYLIVVNNAEEILGPYGQLPDFTPPFSDTTNMLKLATAIGRGIGNTAAHETAHQLNFVNTLQHKYSLILPGLDCGPGASEPKDCQNGINSVYEAASTGAWAYIDYNPPIQWELIDRNALQNYFGCTATDCK